MHWFARMVECSTLRDTMVWDVMVKYFLFNIVIHVTTELPFRQPNPANCRFD